MFRELIAVLRDRRPFLHALSGKPEPERDRQGHVLVDVSIICRHDAKTGIQRVVRAFWTQISALRLEGFEAVPVYASKWRGYSYAPEDFLENDFLPAAHDVRVVPRRGDIFLGLDLSLRALPRHRRQIGRWKAAGVSTHLVVYDLLPATADHWFSPGLSKRFIRWLDFLAEQCDQALCISRHVAEELSLWLERVHPGRVGFVKIDCIPLGGDMAATRPTSGLPDDFAEILSSIQQTPTFLMVGTVEPRKGYEQVLDALDILEQGAGAAPNVIIVGRPGWMTEKLQKRIRDREAADGGLRWFSEASDEFLGHLYDRCRAVLVASYAEGYGLPVIEALAHKKPVLARDIPVFREFGLPDFHFFKAETGEQLADAMMSFLASASEAPSDIVVPDWHDCTRFLLGILGVQVAIDNTNTTRGSMIWP